MLNLKGGITLSVDYLRCTPGQKRRVVALIISRPPKPRVVLNIYAGGQNNGVIGISGRPTF